MKAGLATAVALGALAAAAALAGCPRAAQTGALALACDDGLTMFAGACVPQRLADEVCGRAARARPGGGCARTKCGRGEAVDLDDGLCLPESMVHARLLHGLPPDPDDPRVPTCHEGVLTSHAGRLACAAGPRACGAGEWFVRAPAGDGGGDAGASPTAGDCQTSPPCGAREMLDERTGRCERVAGAGAVDVGAWARLALGTDGGEGSNALCAPVRAALRTAAPAAGAGPARFQIRLLVPDNDVTQATARVRALPGTSTAATDAAEQAVERLVRMLHFHGGSALAASVSLEVRCSPPLAPEPTLEAPK